MIVSNRDGAVVTVTLDNHDKRNALDAGVCTAIREAVEAAAALAEADDPVRAIVITGAGTAFCAGADLSGGVYNTAFYDAHAEMLRTIESVPVTVIAAINGPAVGADLAGQGRHHFGASGVVLHGVGIAQRVANHRPVAGDEGDFGLRHCVCLSRPRGWGSKKAAHRTRTARACEAELVGMPGALC